MTTRSPWAMSASATWEPMNPRPPVTWKGERGKNKEGSGAIWGIAEYQSPRIASTEQSDDTGADAPAQSCPWGGLAVPPPRRRR